MQTYPNTAKVQGYTIVNQVMPINGMKKNHIIIEKCGIKYIANTCNGLAYRAI